MFDYFLVSFNWSGFFNFFLAMSLEGSYFPSQGLILAHSSENVVS